MPYDKYLLVQTNPSHNEADVPVDTTITARFAKDMDVNRMTADYITVSRVNGDDVAGTVTYRNSERTLVFTPDAPLATGVTYQATLTGGEDGVQSIVGETMGSDHRLSFAVAGEAPLAAPSTVTTSATRQGVTIGWEHPAPSTTAFEVYLSTSNLDPDTAPDAVVWPLTGDHIGTITDSPVRIYRPLDAGTYYAYVRADDGNETSAWVTDQLYVPDASETETPSESPDGDATGLFELIDTYPQQGAMQAYPEEILIQFSQEMDAASVTTDRIYLVQRARTGSVSPLVLRTELSSAKALDATVATDDEDARIVRLVPAEALVTNASFTVVVRSSVRSASGDRLGGSLTFGFDTSESSRLGSMDAIREMLDGLPVSISDRAIQRRLRNVSAYAQDIMERQNTQFDPEDAPYYVDAYINAKVGYDLMVQAQSQASTTGGSRQLAELSIDGGSSSSDAQASLEGLAAEVRQWQDLLYGQHGRGYARSSVVSPGIDGDDTDPDFFSRSEFTESGGA